MKTLKHEEEWVLQGRMRRDTEWYQLGRYDSEAELQKHYANARSKGWPTSRLRMVVFVTKVTMEKVSP